MAEHFKDIGKMQEILQEAQTGLWVIELDDGKAPRMYADSAMLRLLGLEEMGSPEACYQFWYERIDDAHYPLVQQAVDKIISNRRAEIQYLWNHPEWGQLYVRCGGIKDPNYKDGVCMRGYHQNITDTLMLKREYDTVIRTLNENYKGIFLFNLKSKEYKSIKMSDTLGHFSSSLDFETLFSNYVKSRVAEQYQQPVLSMVNTTAIKQWITEGEKQREALYRNKEGHWRRIRIVPSGEFSADYPWVIVAFDEQDTEMEKKIDDAAAQFAVAQMYELVISVDTQNLTYNCIYDSGKLLRSQSHGDCRELCDEMLRMMPSEDKVEFKRVLDADSYQQSLYREGTLRLYDQDQTLHYYRYYSAEVRQDTEKRILMTMRNVDDKQEAQRREDVLENLCQCYYSIYLFDIENDIEEAIWQEEMISSRREFPKGSLAAYYEKFVRNYVFSEDQEKMRRAGSPEFLRLTLSPEQPVYDIDFRRIYPDRLEWVRSRFSIAEMENGQVTKVVFANMNIHEQKLQEMEEELQTQQTLVAAYEMAKKANEAKSNFLAQMSHDIRTPMNAITGMAAIATSQIYDADKVRNCLEKINVSSKHLLSLIDEILDMSRIEKGKIDLLEEPFSFGKLMEEIHSIVQSEASAKKQNLCFMAGQIAHDQLLGDAGRIRQVLINLINNAVKYTQPGGKIKVDAKEVSSKSPERGCFVITVEDNGIGMNKDFLDHIFVPFSRANDTRVRSVQGTGLGMSIAQGIVAAMQGNIQVESQEGKGSRFIVTIYLKTANANPPDSQAAGSVKEVKRIDAGLLKGQRILLVEDNELNREIAQTMLQEAGLAVDCAEDGSQALGTFTASELGTYQAILMDIQMPIMDGYTATRRIRSCGHPQAKTIPIIALTANAFAEDITKALAAGMNDHISKPIDYGRLLEVLRGYEVSCKS